MLFGFEMSEKSPHGRSAEFQLGRERRVVSVGFQFDVDVQLTSVHVHSLNGWITEGLLLRTAKSLFQAEDTVTRKYKAKFDEILHE